jgi:long-chain acyl-CoA synthetase
MLARMAETATTGAGPARATLREWLDRAAGVWPDAPAMEFLRGGRWERRTYAAFRGRVRAAAELAGRLGLAPGAGRAALLLENRPEWLEIYAALACTGVTVVPVDPKLRPAEVAFILGHSGAVAVFAAAGHRPAIEEVAPRLPHLRQVVLVDGSGAGADAPCAGRPCLDYESALAAGAAAACGPDAWYDRHRPSPDDVASILYTSGTTGRPKGAMLTHANFTADADGTLAVIPELRAEDRFLLVLPLFHSFAFTADFVIALRRGCCLCFVGSLRSVADDLRALRPTVLMTVPLLVEKMHARVAQRLAASPLARLLLALGLGRVVGRRVRAAFGGRLRFLVVGGAPCPPGVLRDFQRLGLPAIEGYGLTEAAPVVSLSRPDDARIGTIGYRLPNIEVRIADPDAHGVGELQVRGPIVMQGYLDDPEATAEAFDGGWLRTGDLAAMDADGYIAIRGRRKAMIVNREGKNIYPEEVEQCLARHPFVRDVVVVGCRAAGETGEHVGAILVPDREAIAASRGGVEPSWPEIEALLRQAAREQCRDLADYKHPRKLDIRPEPLERTSTQKVRRCLYQGQLDAR